MGRVILVQPVKLDMRSAEKFGRVEYLMDRAPSPLNPSVLKKVIRDGLRRKKFNVNEDFFCIAGPTLTVSIALVAVLEECRNGVNLLMFDAPTKKYRIRQFRYEGKK